LRSPGHDIGRKRTAFIRSREQQSATALQDAGNSLDQSALGFRIEQKDKPPGNHAIKSSSEKVRIFYIGARHWNARKTASERCHDRGRGVDSIHVEPALDKNLRNWYAGPASEV
jgi:hypothetical protein